jgi:hypothetical protein
LFKDERGIALPLALIVMLVVSLLGVSLWQYSMTDNIQVTRQDNQMKAYYIARSGAESTASWMKHNNGNSLLGKTSAGNAFGDGSYTVRVNEGPGNRVYVESIATVNGVSETVKLAMRKVSYFGAGEALFDNAVYASSVVILGGNVNILGNVQSGGTLTINGNAVSINGTFGIKKMDYPEAIFPDGLTNALPFNLDIGNKATTNIFDGQRYGSVKTKSDLIFTPNGNTMVVRMSKLETQNAAIKVNGPGRVLLYIDDLLDLKGDVLCSPEQFLVFAAPGAVVSLPKGNSQFNGYVYGPGCNLDFSGTQNFRGAIIAGTAHTSGNTSIGYTILNPGQKILADNLEFAPSFDIDHWVN